MPPQVPNDQQALLEPAQLDLWPGENFAKAGPKLGTELQLALHLSSQPSFLLPFASHVIVHLHGSRRCLWHVCSCACTIV